MPPALPARWAIASLSVAVLLASLGTSIANVGLPGIGEAFAASFAQVQWVVLAYLLASTSLVVGAGRLGDIVGRRRLLLAGIGLFTLASALCGAAPTLPALVAARALQGLGAAIMLALSTALIGEAVPKAGTGRAIGLLGSMSAIGTALGPTLGGVLIAGPGWRAVFLVNVPLGLLALLLARRSLPAERIPPTADQPRFDAPGTLLLALTLAAYALAVTAGRGGFGPVNAGLLGAAMLGAGLFLWVEARAPSPLIRVAMLREPALRAGLATSALVSTVMMASLIVGPFYLSRALGLEPAAVGLAMSAGPVVAALSGVPAGRLVDRLGARRLAILGLLGMAAGASLLSLVPMHFGIAGYVAPLIILAAGYALFQTANNTTVMANVWPEGRGVVSGLLSLSRNLGLITGASVMGAVFALAAAPAHLAAQMPEAVAAGMRATFAFAALLVVLALTIAIGAHRGLPAQPGHAP